MRLNLKNAVSSFGRLSNRCSLLEVHMRTCQLLFLPMFFALTPLSLIAQRSQSPPTGKSVDQFIGSWVLNRDKSYKSYAPRPDRELLIVEVLDDKFRFTDHIRYDNGTELGYWFVTDMKGGCVDETEVNGQAMTSKACLTRMDSTSIVEDNSLVHRQYKLDKRGETLTISTKFKGRLPGRVLPDTRLVFERATQLSLPASLPKK